MFHCFRHMDVFQFILWDTWPHKFRFSSGDKEETTNCLKIIQIFRGKWLQNEQREHSWGWNHWELKLEQRCEGWETVRPVYFKKTWRSHNCKNLALWHFYGLITDFKEVSLCGEQLSKGMFFSMSQKIAIRKGYFWPCQKFRFHSK